MPDGEIIPKGVSFSVDFASLMTDPVIFPDPQKFNPERFLDDSLKGEFESIVIFINENYLIFFWIYVCIFFSDASSYYFTPFAAGRRNCIGQVFAWQEMKIALLRICSNVKITNRVLVTDRNGRPPHKFDRFTFKMRAGSLEQRFLPASS